MAIPSRQIGWGTEENLLWQISKQLESLTRVVYNIGGNTTSTTSTTTTIVPTTTTTTTIGGVSFAAAIGAFNPTDACAGIGTSFTLYYSGSLGNGTALFYDAGLISPYQPGSPPSGNGSYLRIYFAAENQVCTMSGNVIFDYLPCSSITTTTTTTTALPGYYTWNLYSNQQAVETTTICNNTATQVTLYTNESSLSAYVILYTDQALTTQYSIALPGGNGGCIGLGTPGSTVWEGSTININPGEIEGNAGTCPEPTTTTTTTSAPSTRWSPTISQIDINNATGNVNQPYFNGQVAYEVIDVYGNTVTQSPTAAFAPVGVLLDDYIECSSNTPILYYWANDVKVYSVQSTVVQGSACIPQVYTVTLCGTSTTHQVAMTYSPTAPFTPTVGNVYKLEDYPNIANMPNMNGTYCWTINNVSSVVPTSLNYTSLLGGVDYIGWQANPSGFADCAACQA